MLLVVKKEKHTSKETNKDRCPDEASPQLETAKEVEMKTCANQDPFSPSAYPPDQLS